MPDWSEKLQANMIGIFGANGFIGRHLLRRMVAKGQRVRAVSRNFDANLVKELTGKVDFVEADLGNPLAMASSLQGIDVVVQLISTSSPGLQNRYNVSDIQDNVIPHVEFLQSSVALGIKKYIFLSSGGTVYGPTAFVPIAESAATNPISSHGLTKLMVEKYIQMHGRVDGLDFVILRLSNPYGPGQVFRKGQGLIPSVMDRHAMGLPVQIIGDGQATRDYIFIDDVIDAIEACIVGDARQEILNIASGEGRTVLEVLDAMESVIGSKFKREYVGSRKTDVDISVLDITKARSVLSWFPKTPFRAGLEQTLRS
jgi:UDP-glucose 4-epimerase